MGRRPTKGDAIQGAYNATWDAVHILEDIFKKDDAIGVPNGDKLVEVYDKLTETLGILEPFM